MIPHPNRAYKANFCDRDARRVRSRGRGRMKIASSVAIFTAALAYATPAMLRHRASLRLNSQIAWIGTHCQMSIGTRMTTEQVRKIMVPMTYSWKLWISGNIRR